MSSRRQSPVSWVLENVRERLAFMIAVAIVAVAVGAITSVRSIVIVLAGGAGLLVAGLFRPRRSDDEPAIPSEARGRGEPFHWKLPLPDVDLAAAIDRLRAIGLSLDRRRTSTARLSSGSQLRLRLLGGYFIAPSHLPIVVDLDATGALVAVVRDGMGPIASRDRRLETRYALRVTEINDALGKPPGSRPAPSPRIVPSEGR